MRSLLLLAAALAVPALGAATDGAPDAGVRSAPPARGKGKKATSAKVKPAAVAGQADGGVAPATRAPPRKKKGARAQGARPAEKVTGTSSAAKPEVIADPLPVTVPPAEPAEKVTGTFSATEPGVIADPPPVTGPAAEKVTDTFSTSPAAAEAAAEPAPPAESAWKKVVEATGYVSSRTSFTRSRTWGILPTDDQPQAQELLEVNAQLKVKARERSYLSLDLSLLFNVAGEYHGRDASGADVLLADHLTAASLPAVSINELYLFHDFAPQLNVVLGKKRITWGSGLAFNPTDLWNPRRDPTDPTLQRAGVWLAQVEVPLESMTFSLLFAPTVLKSVSGIPTEMLLYPTWDPVDAVAHYQLAARWYALIADADVTAMFFYGNAANDAFTEKARGGLSFARYFFTDYELHVEALFQAGSTRDFINPACVASALAALGCNLRHTPFTSKSLLKEDLVVYPKVLVGTKRQFSDDSLLSLEYLYQGDGWTKEQFQDFASGLGLLEAARAAGKPVSQVPGASQLLGQGTGSDGLPTRLSFDPRRRHYLFLTYQKPNLFDDFTIQLVVMANLEDLSTLWSASVAWAPTQWLTLTAYGYAPLQGLDSLSATTPAGTFISEFGITPFAVRAMFEARVFF